MTETTTTVSARKKQPALHFKAGADVQAHRKKLGVNQSEFWSRINVTQSGGSRYESGRNIPRPVQLLLHLTYGTERQAGDLLSWLRAQNP